MNFYMLGTQNIKAHENYSPFYGTHNLLDVTSKKVNIYT